MPPILSYLLRNCSKKLFWSTPPPLLENDLIISGAACFWNPLFFPASFAPLPLINAAICSVEITNTEGSNEVATLFAISLMLKYRPPSASQSSLY